MKFLPKKIESQKAQIYQRTRICNKHHLLINYFKQIKESVSPVIFLGESV
jgi:hypothetical protein